MTFSMTLVLMEKIFDPDTKMHSIGYVWLIGLWFFQIETEIGHKDDGKNLTRYHTRQ